MKPQTVETERDESKERAELDLRVGGIIGRLTAEAKRRVAERADIEERWIVDLQQLHGQYDEKTEAELIKSEKSRLFLNKTRPITNAMSARLMDLLFPTDDRNWGIGPSPVPELAAQMDIASRAATETETAATEASQAATANVNAAPAAVAKRMEAEQARAKVDELTAIMDEARVRAALMQDEIEDQLKACQYQAASRDVIEMACKIGTGVIEGPVRSERIRKKWVKSPEGGFELTHTPDERPSYRAIDTWGFFPDPERVSVMEGEGILVRHMMNKKRLRRLARDPAFNKDAIRQLLESGPKTPPPAYLSRLRAINSETGAIISAQQGVYEVWKYSGPLEPEEMAALAANVGDEDTMREALEADPLEEIHAVVWFCDNQLLMMALHPMDSDEPTYSTFCLEKDEVSPFGYGVPYMLRHPQRALNAGWRMMMDNASGSVGSQILVNKDIIEPENGDWTFSPNKTWILKQNLPANTQAFALFDIPSHQAEFANIIALAKENMDEEAAMPAIAQGEQGANVTKTSGGMAMLLNSANVVFRRIVKNFDDDFTTPNIRRIYDWNMQHSTKDHIKGDYEIDARGSSVLLVRELQSQNLMVMGERYSVHPVFGPMLKNRELLRETVASMMIPSDKLVMTDAEIDEEERLQAEQPDPAMELEMRKLDILEQEIEMKAALANMENDTKLRVAQLNYEATMQKVAEALNMNDDQLRAKLADGDAARRSKERTIAAEIAAKARPATSDIEIANS